MSDLQIVTGFAIILSGFAQFQCGLAALKWRIILDLAWFSCLAHLACLSVLRRHLHTHTFERVLRLFAMGALAASLAVGILITANYKWVLMSHPDNTPAICIVGCYLQPVPKEYEYISSPMDPVEWFWTPIISASFVVSAFIFRVVRLHKVLFVGVSRATKWLDGQAQRLLWVLFRILCTEEDIYSLKRSLAYRPVFGIVMILRLLLESWTSFAVEVCYLFKQC